VIGDWELGTGKKVLSVNFVGAGLADKSVVPTEELTTKPALTEF
jgi:hypothetical protein